jgi:hypothetical protein
MGVTLTGQAAAELSGAAEKGQAKAQTALAQGITAQKGGNAAASLAYYYQAAQYDPRLKEAAARVNQLSASVRTGSLGEDIRNDIAWRDQWIKLYEEAYAYIRAHPDALVALEYSPELKQERIDYDKRIVTFSAAVQWTVIEEPPTLKMLNDLDAGLEATGRNHEWRLEGADRDRSFRMRNREAGKERFFSRAYMVEAELYDDKGRCIGEDKMPSDINVFPSPLDALFRDRGRGRPISCLIWPTVREEVTGRGRNRKTVHTSILHFADNIFTRSKYMQFVVKADDITDNMTIKIVNIREFDGTAWRQLAYDHGYIGPYHKRELPAVMRSGPDIIPVSVMR